MIVKVMYLRQYCELRVEISAVPCPARDPSEGTIFGSNDMISKLLHMRAFYPNRPIVSGRVFYLGKSKIKLATNVE